MSPATSETDLRLTDQPHNFAGTDDGDAVFVNISPAYLWKLYLAHVAFSLMLEIDQHVPWSLTTYPDSTLRYLLDSTSIGWRVYSTGNVMLGVLPQKVPDLRVNNLPQTAFADPRWTYGWIAQAQLIGATRRETIERLLEWMRRNLTHFYGGYNFANMFAVWQYRGYSPISRIVAGTVDSNNPTLGMAHYTAGCHGSVGLMNAALRVLNIPVQPIWVCNHQLAYFVSEDLYLDHGDDPYNLNVRMGSSPVGQVLIDSPTYRHLFGADETVNITDSMSPACANVGYAAAHFH
jgi:hypothetical protein